MAVAEEFSRPSATAPEYDRQPPQDIPAEQSVLGGMLMSKDAIADVVEVLQGPDFYRPAHQVVFDCILDLYGRGEPADAITVAAELNRTDQLSKMGGAVYLHTLIASTPTAANAGYYAAIVAEQAVLRRLVEAGTRVVQLGYGAAGGKGDVDDIVDRAQQEIYDVTEKRMSEDYSRLEDILQPTMDELDAIASRGGVSRGVPTGIRDLDELTNGLQAGQMIVIAARPGVGKIDARIGHCTLGVGEAPLASGHLLAGDEQARDHHASAVGRGEGAAAPHARRHAVRRGLVEAGPPDG